MVNIINVRSLFSIASIHELPSISIDFVPAFNQSELDADVIMELPLGMGVHMNRGEWFLNLNKPRYGIKQASENWFHILKNCLERRGYHQSQVEPCVFYIKDLAF